MSDQLLTPQEVQAAGEAIGKLKEEGLSILLVEQNAALALELATHAYVLETGHVVMSGPSEAVKNDKNVRKSYLGY